jgi:hypothetical protein
MYTKKVLTTIRQLYSAQRLDLKSFYTIVTSASGIMGQQYSIEICSDIIAWAENQDSDESTTIYWLAHDCLAEVMK